LGRGFGEGAGLKTLSLSRNEAQNQKDRWPQDLQPIATAFLEML